MASDGAPSAEHERFLIFGPTGVSDGVGRFNNELVKGLTADGHEVRVLTTSPSSEIPGAPNIEFPPPPDGLSGLAQWEAYYLAHVTDTLHGNLREQDPWEPSTIIVNGKYTTDGPMAGSYEALLELVDELVAAEREGR